MFVEKEEDMKVSFDDKKRELEEWVTASLENILSL
jgi:hypothetical protein